MGLASYADILWARHAIFLPHADILWARHAIFLPHVTSPKNVCVGGYNGVNRQPSKGQKFNRQPSNERVKISRQIS